jgi:RNA polymerase sigma-70 factor (ECF subfamily)
MNADVEHGKETTTDTTPPDAEQIGALRQDMLRFAQLQLRDLHLAEDVVHEAIAAALKSSDYAGRAQLKTWVFAILRNKIVDVIRERGRHPSEPIIEDTEPELEHQFKPNGHWVREQRPTAWRDPETSLENDQFWVIFEACLNDLPENPARVFMMREHLGLEVAEICQELAISENNCWVLMHRARMRLRKCLENHFMQQGLNS